MGHNGFRPLCLGADLVIHPALILPSTPRLYRKPMKTFCLLQQEKGKNRIKPNLQTLILISAEQT